MLLNAPRNPPKYNPLEIYQPYGMHTQESNEPLSRNPVVMPFKAINTPSTATWKERGISTVAVEEVDESVTVQTFEM